MKKALFHADDWGLSPAINHGILELARRRLLRSASCMANVPYLQHGRDELVAYAAEGVEIYLHLCLTYGNPLTSARSLVRSSGEFLSHKELILKSALGLLNVDEVRIEIEAQMEHLEELGFPISGVNGHHHVHLLPRIGGLLQEIMTQHGAKKLLMLEDADHRPSFYQTRIFRLLGGLHSGVEPVKCRYLRPADLQSATHFFRKLEGGSLPLLVHPALWNDFDDAGMTDSLRQERVDELRRIVGYLNG